jgi:hypothetical protein
MRVRPSTAVAGDDLALLVRAVPILVALTFLFSLPLPPQLLFPFPFSLLLPPAL